VSVAAVTPSPRETVSRASPRSSRNTAAVLRPRDILPPRPGAATPDLLLRSLRGARPRSICLLFVHDTPLVRISSACEVSQSTVMRGSPSQHGPSGPRRGSPTDQRNRFGFNAQSVWSTWSHISHGKPSRRSSTYDKHLGHYPSPCSSHLTSALQLNFKR